MQCLECSVVGCGPSSTSPDSSVHMMCHFIASGHNFGKFQLFYLQVNFTCRMHLIKFASLILTIYFFRFPFDRLQVSLVVLEPKSFA